MTMTLEEKTLYHQIHPLKLLTDWSTGIVALYPLWQHNILIALLIMLVPPVCASYILMRYANLERYKQSSFGKYIHQYMTRAIEMMRLAGYALMAIGAWIHLAWLILVGLFVILLAWFSGLYSERGNKSY